MRPVALPIAQPDTGALGTMWRNLIGFLTGKPEPDESTILRLGMLLFGVLALLCGIVAALQGHWAAWIVLPFGGLILWAWRLACRQAAGRREALPKDVPRLYPELDGVELCEFLSPEQHEAIREFPVIMILPFMSKSGFGEHADFGAGLAQLMIRDLMLVPNLSVRGPEDTSLIFVETAREWAPENAGLICVTGAASFDADTWRLDLEILQGDRTVAEVPIVDAEPSHFVLRCAVAIAETVGGLVPDSVMQKWRQARPTTLLTLSKLGYIQLAMRNHSDEEKAAAAIQLLKDDPRCALPAGAIDSDLPEARQYYLEALRRDPDYAQMCFLLFCSVWDGQGWQPEAMQFARRAIELSPGHGKAHMCAPNAAHPQAQMLRHSELGYRLLPGNHFAISNYIRNLSRTGAPVERLEELAKEAIEIEPLAPASYRNLIAAFSDAGEHEAALKVAEQLQTLFEPEMHPRTLVCLKQNPEVARLLESGDYDPAAENRQRITELRALLRQTD